MPVQERFTARSLIVDHWGTKKVNDCERFNVFFDFAYRVGFNPSHCVNIFRRIVFIFRSLLDFRSMIKFYWLTYAGVNMPGLSVDLPAMSAKDMQDIKWGIKNDVITNNLDTAICKNKSIWCYELLIHIIRLFLRSTILPHHLCAKPPMCMRLRRMWQHWWQRAILLTTLILRSLVRLKARR